MDYLYDHGQKFWSCFTGHGGVTFSLRAGEQGAGEALSFPPSFAARSPVISRDFPQMAS